MSNTLTIRLPEELREWLEQESDESGLSMGEIIRAQLEKARANKELPAFLELAGCVAGERDLSSKRGFER